MRTHGAHLDLLVFALAASALGCAGRAERYERGLVSSGIEARSGHALAPEGTEAGSPSAAFPGGVDAADGLGEEEAVAVALWRNLDFQATLADLGIARADVIQAGLLTNPAYSVLFPLGDKQLEFTAALPLEAFFLRPARLEAAELDAEVVAERLVAEGLGLIARVRAAFGQFVLETRRASLAEEAAGIAAEVADFQAGRLAAGDLSEHEARLARAAALEARLSAARAGREAAAAAERLRALIGLRPGEARFDASLVRVVRPERLRAGLDGDPEEAVRAALSLRPEYRAAELEFEAARRRSGLSRWEPLALSAVVDGNEEGESGFEVGPGVEGELPIFDWNQGGRARAEAELERAVWRRASARERIVLEVREARLGLAQALEELTSWQSGVLPALEEAARRAEGTYALGASSRLPVLEAMAKLNAARVREAEAAAAVGRATAGLERALGGRLVRGQAATESVSNNPGVGPKPSEDKPGKERRRGVSAERYVEGGRDRGGSGHRRSPPATGTRQPQPAEASRDYCSGSESASSPQEGTT
jgi:cobalt-zinc-cadmium efflux system outer membrane protein